MAIGITKSQLEQVLHREQQRFIDEWMRFLSFASISADPAYHTQCVECAGWLADHLKAIGFSVEILETSGKPVVCAHYDSGTPGAGVLFYGHYDVQPVDPIELWTSPPFEPQFRGERLYARGALDNKGQSFYFIKAVETLIRAGVLRGRLTLLFEGEEECGSRGLSGLIPQVRGRLGADVLLVCDTEAHAPGVPAITMGLRGLVGLGARLSGPRTDLHSGIHGGLAPNPATAIARLTASFHAADGSVAVQGFYDGLPPPVREDLECARRVPFDAERYAREVGVAPVGGERGREPVERNGFRPTLEINGIHSGYGGPGSKTIIPAHAEVKVTCRLVRGQNPAHILELVKEHITRHAPEGLKLEFTHADIGGPALAADTKAPAVKRAAMVLREVCGADAVFTWCGASIPILSALVEASGAVPVFVGFGLVEDNMHAPNESFSLTQFRDGFLYAGLMLAALQEGHVQPVAQRERAVV